MTTQKKSTTTKKSAAPKHAVIERENSAERVLDALRVLRKADMEKIVACIQKQTGYESSHYYSTCRKLMRSRKIKRKLDDATGRYIYQLAN